MTREGIRLIAALAAAVLAAALLAACGSSDSSSTPSEANSQAGNSQGGSRGHSGSQEQQNDTGQSGSQGQRNGPKSFAAKEVSVPLKVSGGGSEQFRVKGGDNSIQEFGEEGDESELAEAAEAVHDFYVARATGDWAGACSRMSASLREQLEQLASKSSGVRGCAPFLEAFTSPLSAAAWREITTVDAASLRHEGEQAFLIYTGAHETVYAMPLKEEDGTWRVTALSATTLG